MMVENKGKNLISIAIIVAGVLVVGALVYLDLGKDLKEQGQATVSQPETPGNETSEAEVPASSLNDFAKCLTEKGAKFYGASWCGHCANQKTLFGEAFQYVNYIECWDDASNSLVAACEAAKIEAFPTWDFADGNRQLGELTLEDLSQLSGCELK